MASLQKRAAGPHKPTASVDKEALAAQLLGQRLRDLGTVRSVDSIAPNIYASRMASIVAELTTSRAGTVKVVLKGGDPSERTVTGQPWGAANEATVYESILHCVPAYRSPFLGRFDHDGRLWLVLRWLDGALRVSKSRRPDAMLVAARWLGLFQAQAAEVVLSRVTPPLVRYDTAALCGWLELNRPAVRQGWPAWTPVIDEVLTMAPAIGALLSSRPTLVHGDLYPQNVLYDGEAVVPIDWEWAGMGAGELDFASLLMSWPAATVEACLAAYWSARWPAGADPEAGLRLAAARLYHAARDLDRQLRKRPAIPQYLDQMKEALEVLAGEGDRKLARRATRI